MYAAITTEDLFVEKKIYAVSRVPASNSTRAKNERVNFSS